MTFIADQKIIHRMRQLLSTHLQCTCGEVQNFKQILIIDYIQNHPELCENETDVAEYHVVLKIAEDFDCPELAYLMHLYTVGYFPTDTQNYKIKQGELYETVNLNYLNSNSVSNLCRKKVA